MIERKLDNNGRSQIPRAFVGAFPDDFLIEDDPILTRMEIDKLIEQINEEFIIRIVGRIARNEIMNA